VFGFPLLHLHLQLRVPPSKRQLWVGSFAATAFPIQDGGHGHLGPLATDASGQLDVLGHNGDALGVNGAQIGVLEQTDQVRLAGLLQIAHLKWGRDALLHDRMK